MRGIFIILLFVAFCSNAQQYEEFKNSRLGIKTSVNFSSFAGNKFRNPRLRFGYTAGLYFKTKINDNQHIYSELLANFKGSNFRNNRTDAYVKISTFHVDLPIYFVQDFDENRRSILIGPQISYHMLSSLYVLNAPQARRTGLSFMPWSLDACLAYHKNNKGISPQFGVKVGLTNMNNGINFDDVYPSTGREGVVRSLSFELGLVF